MTNDNARKLLEIARESLAPTALYPEEMWSTWDYTDTGNVRCHPRTLGLFAKAMWQTPDVDAVEIDVQLGAPHQSFKPDIVGLSKRGNYVLLVDFESPNSSDARVPGNVDSYIQWAIERKHKPEYLIVTSLPRQPTPTWRLRFTDKDGTNPLHRGKGSEIRASPYDYWYAFYRAELARISGWRSAPITIANFDGRVLEEVPASMWE